MLSMRMLISFKLNEETFILFYFFGGGVILMKSFLRNKNSCFQYKFLRISFERLYFDEDL